MCKVLQVNRSTYYYESKAKEYTDEITPLVINIFKASRNNYGTRKIKVELKKVGYIVSRRKIGRIMKQNGLVSNYTVAQYKPHVDKCNESKIANELNREFNTDKPYAAVVSDLTYVRVNRKWNYVCLLVDLFNREIIGFSAGPNKDAPLVYYNVQPYVDIIPYGLHRARNENIFKGTKIISIRKCEEPTFTYVNYDSYVSQTFNIIKTKRIDMVYLTGLLNSKLIKFWLKHMGKMQGNNYQVDKEPLMKIPILAENDIKYQCLL